MKTDSEETARTLAGKAGGDTKQPNHSTRSRNTRAAAQGNAWDGRSSDLLPLSVRGVSRAARLTGLSERTIGRLVARNALPHRRCGRALLFLPDELRAWADLGCPDDPGAAERVRAAMRKGVK